MKKRIIFIHFNRFLNEFDWKRYELDKLSKKFNVEVNILINYVHPHLRKKKYHKYYKNKKVNVVYDLKLWKKKIKRLNKNSHFIFQTFPYNFAALKIYYFIKKQGFKSSVIFMNNLPSYSDFKFKEKKFNIIYKKFLSIIFRFNHFRAILEKKIIEFLFVLFSSFLKINFSLVCGNIKKKNYNSRIIRINSWDYSNLLNNKEKIKEKNYILYLSDGEARYQSDSNLWKTKRLENKNKLLEKLRNFFDIIEKEYGCEIIIAAHPRSNPKLKIDTDLGNRKNYYGKTASLTKKANLIITTGSTAISYAVLEKKPILFIKSYQEQKKIIAHLKYLKFLANLLKCKIIDIDNTKEIINKKTINYVNLQAYNYFKKKYIIFRKMIPNYKILTKYINKLN